MTPRSGAVKFANDAAKRRSRKRSASRIRLRARSTRRPTCLPSATPATAPLGEGVPVARDRGLPDWRRHRSARLPWAGPPPRPQGHGLGRSLIQSAQSTDLRPYEPLSSRVEMYSVVQSSPVAPTALFDCTKRRTAAVVDPWGVKVELSITSRAPAVPQIKIAQAVDISNFFIGRSSLLLVQQLLGLPRCCRQRAVMVKEW